MARRYVPAETILKELGEAAEQAAKEALGEGAELLVQEAKSRCPVYEGSDRRVVRGALRDSIRAIRLRNGTKYRVVADAQAKDGLYYGKIVEFSPAIDEPFLYPAFEAVKDEIRGRIVAAVREAVRKP